MGPLSLAWISLIVGVLVAWFRVHAAFLLYVVAGTAAGVVLGPSSVVTLLVALAPPLYAAVFVAAMAMRRKQPAFRIFAAAKKWPLGGVLFDRLVLALLAPHKSVYGVRTRRWTESELVVEFVCGRWLENPFQSVDVGALVGIGEMVAFGVCQQAILQSGRRAIPVAVRAEFAKKSKGRLTCRGTALAPPPGAERHSCSAEVRDAANELCCTVHVDLHLSNLGARRT